MPISFLPSHDALPHYAVFGKLPGSADFVRMGQSSHPAVQELDGLIARSISYCAKRQIWDEGRAQRVGPSLFSFTTHDRKWCFFGVLQPSRDSAGRFYPLTAGIILPAHAVMSHGPELAIANEPYFTGLRQAVGRAIDFGDLPACQRCLTGWAAGNPHAREDLGLAGQLLTRHLTSTSVFRLQMLLGFSSNPPEAALLPDILLAFIYCTTQLRRDGERAAKLVIPLPLSVEKGEDTLDMATWLALYRAAGGNKCFPDFMLNGTSRYAMSLVPGRLGERCLGAIWGMEDPQPDATIWRQNPAWSKPANALAHSIQNPNVDLASVVSIVERVSRHVR